ncbi:DUF4259 domain-containing protein [Paraflavitalea sp. CAU 1676]|uniref:DUF4259 domain-containing protein n=1 Tax=Paraflavitalea sp. CAU 1676 TaxID=3032598 RepID=UPI0023DC35E9|nr:DUF4259 domain-containing protein [Paraflavitalea sp. CAU 1676]MDF2186956.1 DUF4259 domain-containing protein [Paraflavitalea sp. CAU 1676]
MGTWGHRNFENDAALDFVYEVEDNGFDRIEKAIKQVAEFPEETYLEADYSVAALAAIEFVAAAKGNPSEDFPESAEDWLQKAGTGPLLSIDAEKLNKVIERVRSNSELRDLWQEEGDEPTEWLAVLSDLESRIS